MRTEPPPGRETVCVVVRSPLDSRVWVPFPSFGVHDDASYAGGQKVVKAWVEKRMDAEVDSTTAEWRRIDADTIAYTIPED